MNVLKDYLESVSGTQEMKLQRFFEMLLRLSLRSSLTKAQV